MTEPTYEQRLVRRYQQELRELENPQAQGQAILDQWWRERCELAEQEARTRRYLDPYN